MERGKSEGASFPLSGLLLYGIAQMQTSREATVPAVDHDDVMDGMEEVQYGLA